MFWLKGIFRTHVDLNENGCIFIKIFLTIAIKKSGKYSVRNQCVSGGHKPNAASFKTLFLYFDPEERSGQDAAP
jgi:hypothetical protein